jgi:phosphoserine phosphatase
MTASPIPGALDATLVLVRHGESEFIVEGRFQGQAENPLSATGRRQAELVATRLADLERSPALPIPLTTPNAIVHSPLGRAAQTATAVATANPAHPAPHADPRFSEIGQGEWEGLHRDEIETRFADPLAGWRARPAEVWAPGGESLAAVADRVHDGLNDLLGGLADGRVRPRLDPVSGYGRARTDTPWSLLVGHDGVFKVTMLVLFALPLERFWMWSFDLCGITVVEFRAGRAVLRAVNLTEHLAPTLDAAALAERAARGATGAL